MGGEYVAGRWGRVCGGCEVVGQWHHSRSLSFETVAALLPQDEELAEFLSCTALILRRRASAVSKGEGK